jgi:hypothetical protein
MPGTGFQAVGRGRIYPAEDRRFKAGQRAVDVPNSQYTLMVFQEIREISISQLLEFGGSDGERIMKESNTEAA